jgi:hypothetical protein
VRIYATLLEGLAVMVSTVFGTAELLVFSLSPTVPAEVVSACMLLVSKGEPDGRLSVAICCFPISVSPVAGFVYRGGFGIEF